MLNHSLIMFTTKKLINIALEEDLGPGDITTDLLISPDDLGQAKILAKEPLVIAGLDIAREVFLRLDNDLVFQALYNDGDMLKKGDIIVKLQGRLCSLLKGERTALNFLQRLSGIATHTRDYINEINNSCVRIVDTRKTTPGWRVLEKYAVRAGGAYNHRMGLYDGVLIKDNHIAACGGITEAIERAKKNVSHFIRIEVEVEDLYGVKEALKAKADVIMLDNMNIKQIKQAIELINNRAVVEVSGGIKKKNLKALADTGVDIISVGALTHSAKAVDISMDIKNMLMNS
ncbi:putative nicotinate-nucleotide pyrophosphorylase (carboxylating) [Candidatus Magnetomoraceae bacterium gMMP-1]